jgi:hypothetical protein
LKQDNTDHTLLTLDDFDLPSATPISTPSNPPNIAPTSSHTASSTPAPSSAYTNVSSSTTTTLSPSAIDSAQSFISLCSLSLILDAITAEFFTVKHLKMNQTASKRVLRAGRQTRLRVVESFGGDLDRWREELRPELRIGGGSTATGVKSMQLCYLGLAVMLARTTLDMYDPSDEADAREIDLSVSSSLEVSISFRFSISYAHIPLTLIVSFSLRYPSSLSKSSSSPKRSLRQISRTSSGSPVQFSAHLCLF